MNWKQRIERAKKKGKFTEDDRIKSSDFFTCAVSEIIDIREVRFLPEILTKLGFIFKEYVYWNNIPQAEKTYKKIQRLKI